MALSGEVVYLGSLNDDNVMVNNLARISILRSGRLWYTPIG
jgi:hypothetical protein